MTHWLSWSGWSRGWFRRNRGPRRGGRRDASGRPEASRGPRTSGCRSAKGLQRPVRRVVTGLIGPSGASERCLPGRGGPPTAAKHGATGLRRPLEASETVLSLVFRPLAASTARIGASWRRPEASKARQARQTGPMTAISMQRGDVEMASRGSWRRVSASWRPRKGGRRGQRRRVGGARVGGGELIKRAVLDAVAIRA